MVGGRIIAWVALWLIRTCSTRTRQPASLSLIFLGRCNCPGSMDSCLYLSGTCFGPSKVQALFERQSGQRRGLEMGREDESWVLLWLTLDYVSAARAG